MINKGTRQLFLPIHPQTPMFRKSSREAKNVQNLATDQARKYDKMPNLRAATEITKNWLKKKWWFRQESKILNLRSRAKHLSISNMIQNIAETRNTCFNSKTQESACWTCLLLCKLLVASFFILFIFKKIANFQEKRGFFCSTLLHVFAATEGCFNKTDDIFFNTYQIVANQHCIIIGLTWIKWTRSWSGPFWKPQVTNG
jgi:uncharacterized membrane protein YobD (UPF0266 family)